MAKTKDIDLGALEARGRQALARLPWWQRLQFSAAEKHPTVYHQYLTLAAGELPAPLVSGKEFAAAMSAVGAWSAAQGLYEKAVQLYHDPQVRAVAGNEATMQYYWQHPDLAMKALAEHSAQHPRAYRDGEPLAQVLAAIGEFETFHETHSSAEEVSASAAPRPAPQRPPQPKPAPGHEQGASAAVTRPAPIKPATASYDELVAKPHLSKAEYAQLLEWTEEDLKIENAIEGGGSDDDNS